MSDYVLTTQSALGGIERDFGEVTIAESTSHAIMSVAVPRGGEKELSEAIALSFKTKLPPVGESTTSTIKNARILGMQQDQFFLLFEYSGLNAVNELSKEIRAAAYLTDQSDSWVIITISGLQAYNALQRTCLVDLHRLNFPSGAVARTVMDHLSTIIVREEPNTFLLMSPSSSARSFLNCVETSIRNIT